MKHLRKNGGFTLVEMVVCIAIASLVTMAATTVLMLALRVNRQTSDTASKQYTVRTLLSTMENAAVDGSIKSVKTDHINYWELLNEKSEAIFRYSAFDKTISVNGTKVLDDIYASNAVLEDNLLNIVLVTKDGTFDASIYCRTMKPEAGDSEVQPSPEEELPVEKFIRILTSQYGSRGEIVYASTPDENAPKYFSEWYIGEDLFQNGSNDPDKWNPSTPWCACYVSWALEEAGLPGPETYITNANDKEIKHDNWFANVHEFMEFFKTESLDYGQSWEITPAGGNLIFFDMNSDETADHIGVVLNVHGGMVYTIEGNNEGRVTIARYSVNDERILGYGSLFDNSGTT